MAWWASNRLVGSNWRRCSISAMAKNVNSEFANQHKNVAATCHFERICDAEVG
jgi:hypothetical protein